MELRPWLRAAMSLKPRERGSTDLVERANDQCGGSGFYTAPIGLVYDIFCKQDLNARGIGTLPASSLQECMDLCSTAQVELCYGVTYDAAAQQCNLKSNQATRSALAGNSPLHSAIGRINLKQDTCQFGNATIQSSTTGERFEIRCQQDMLQHDYCPTNAPYQPTSASSALNLCPWHAETLQDCMELCSKAAPLCKAVSFSPTMVHGFGNCYPKADLDMSSISSLPPGPDNNHMAIAKLPILDLSCATDGSVVASDGRNFSVHCDRDSPGMDLATMHKETLQDCVEMCASYRNTSAVGTCTGITYDPTQSSGYQNCFLKSVLTRPLKQVRQRQVAVLPGALTTAPSGGSSNSTSSGKSTGNSSSLKAWIVGPIVGGVALLLLLVGFPIWCVARRRRRRRQSRLATELGGAEITQVPRTYNEKRTRSPLPLMRKRSNKYELGAHQEAVHEIGSSTQGIHELPSNEVRYDVK